MNTIIIISNDPRMVLVREALQPLLLAKVSIVPDFNSGLEEVFDKRPQVVFIQHEIAGVTGEMVSRTIKALLQANSPRFIHLLIFFIIMQNQFIIDSRNGFVSFCHNVTLRFLEMKRSVNPHFGCEIMKILTHH